ncbi:uncharacterized protein BXZ73DRAFT_102640 [Epithele typhae]|uniref:uncharacterized protein n=1 Tax=Epithele typhae TaxID=378194 RepID=UPI002007CE04|nr:uncharacterized protein BXZ73DRAFT_102640 [Epithele typhae]KAH9927510.1 hypothetical protein BXZ73DRAFT_102640 [Epithele typhae]
MPATPAEALKLKNEGNALFVKNDFSAAYKKYSAAIKLDPKNAVLYCNRAACAYGLHRYLDASTDATKATELDPTYAKAWARLAAAELSLDAYTPAVRAYKRAIAALPNENLTPGEEKQRKQYEAELATAETKLKPPKRLTSGPRGWRWGRRTPSSHGCGRTACFLTMRRGRYGRAWIIQYAHMQWEGAYKNLKAGHAVPGPPGENRWFAYYGVIEGLTNAIVSDSRVYHISDSRFPDMYNNQMKWEAFNAKAWTDFGAQKVIEEVPKRLKKEGWEGWIFRAFGTNAFDLNKGAGLNLYTAALEVLRWGAEKYKDVGTEKGVIFQLTFIRGVKCMRLVQYMNTMDSTSTVTRHSIPLDELLAGADEILEELRDDPSDPSEALQQGESVGFWYAFHRYPVGVAHSVRGFAFHRKAMKLREEAGTLTNEADQLYSQASEEYLEAALIYPPDDFYHVWNLHCALHAQFDVSASARFLIFVLDMMEKAIPLAAKLWENSADWPRIRPAFDADMQLLYRVNKAMEAGTIQVDTIVTKATMGVPQGAERRAIGN